MDDGKAGNSDHDLLTDTRLAHLGHSTKMSIDGHTTNAYTITNDYYITILVLLAQAQ